MRKLGLIGGMGWVSTRLLHPHTRRPGEGGPPGSAPLLIESLDFWQLHAICEGGHRECAAAVLSDSASGSRRRGGAIIVAANSMHKVYDTVAAAVSVPIFHIADCVGERMKADGVVTAALFGTSNVMTESFYRRRLVAHGIDLLPPDMENVEALDRIVYDEVMRGRVTGDARREIRTMIAVKQQHGARGILLACTELEMVVDVGSNVLPVFDTTRIHAERAVEWI